MTPIIMHITQNQIQDIGGTAEMACTVSNPLNYYVFWTKLDLTKSIEPSLYSFGNTLNIKDSRISIRQDSMMDKTRYTLQVPTYHRCTLYMNSETMIIFLIFLQDVPCDRCLLPTQLKSNLEIIKIFRLMIFKTMTPVSIAAKL